jgi:hypothetical protein
VRGGDRVALARRRRRIDPAACRPIRHSLADVLGRLRGVRRARGAAGAGGFAPASWNADRRASQADPRALRRAVEETFDSLLRAPASDVAYEREALRG